MVVAVKLESEMVHGRNQCLDDVEDVMIAIAGCEGYGILEPIGDQEAKSVGEEPDNLPLHLCSEVRRDRTEEGSFRGG